LPTLSAGNIILSASALTVRNNVLSRLVAVVVFMGGSALAGFLGILYRLGQGATPRQVAVLLLTLEAVFLSAAWAVGVAVGVPTGDDKSSSEWQVVVVVVFLALSMGVQNSTTRERGVFTDFPPTTAMTATVVNLGSVAGHLLILLPVLAVPPLAAGAAAASVAQARKELSSNVAQLLKFGPSFIAFLAGAAIGAACQFYFGWNSVSVPFGVLLLLIADLLAAEAGVTVPVRQTVAKLATAVRSSLPATQHRQPPATVAVLLLGAETAEPSSR
jgi:uncharacterized membrane protein YoaK (UPF0700 family)